MDKVTISWSLPIKANENQINGLGLVFYDGSDSTRRQIGLKEWEALAPEVQVVAHRNDVVCCFNHDFSKILARQSNGTLQLKRDQKGINYQAKLNEKNPNHVALFEDIKSDLITGSSAVFAPLAYRWEEEADKDVILYTRIELVEIGPVTLPAMTAAKVAASEGISEFSRLAIETRKRFNQRA